MALAGGAIGDYASQRPERSGVLSRLDRGRRSIPAFPPHAECSQARSRQTCRSGAVACVGCGGSAEPLGTRRATTHYSDRLTEEMCRDLPCPPSELSLT